MLSSDIVADKVQVEELSEAHIITQFDCEDDDLNEFLKEDALRYKKQLIAKTFVITYNENIIAFFSVMNDAIKLKLEETEDTNNLKRLHEYPALKIGRLGVDKNYKRKGFGKFIIDFAIGLGKIINESSSCRFITVDSYPDSVIFYEKYSFMRNLTYQKKKDFISMRLDLLDKS